MVTYIILEDGGAYIMARYAWTGRVVNLMAAGFEQIEARFVAWAALRADIQGVIVLGSRAREDHPADAWSDLDFMIFADDPGRLLSDAGWIAEIGDPWLTFVEGERERRVLFAGGLDVDFNVFSTRELLHMLEHSPPPGAGVAFSRGFRIVVDKVGFTDRLCALSTALPPPAPPTERAFLEVVNNFLYHTVWTAKKLRRGELWTAKGCCDGFMKWECLLPMLEWHARAMRGWDHDTWFRGRFLENWADPRAIEALRSAFARYDAGDIARALAAMADLFRWLATETAGRLGFAYPDEADARVSEWVKTCLAEMGSS